MCVDIDFVKDDLDDQVEMMLGSMEGRMGGEVIVRVGPIGEFS